MAFISLDAQDAGLKKTLSAAAPRRAPGRTSRPAKLSAQALDAELARVVAALEEGIAQRDLSGFYQTFRATHLPSIV